MASLAESDERRSSEIAGRSRQHLNEQRNRLGELNAHRHNYSKKNPGPTVLSSAHWQDYQNFLHRLDTAVNAQQQIVRDCEKNAETHRQRWMVKRQRLESLERVLDKFKAEDMAHAAKLEQKQLDDLPISQAACFDSGDD